jgi:hypothetical protein
MGTYLFILTKKGVSASPRRKHHKPRRFTTVGRNNLPVNGWSGCILELLKQGLQDTDSKARTA